jgi:integrase
MVTINLESKTARSRLDVRWKPYWHRLSGGISLGYRRSAGSGSWSVRISDGKRGNSIKRIAAADDAEPADGRAIMSFAQARDAALRLSRGETEEAKAAVVTLADAIEAYKGDLTARGAGADNVTRLLFNLTAPLLKRPVGLLDVTELRKWRDAAVKRMAPASVNRLITILKAVLNLAASRDERLSTRPWEIGLAALPEATTARNVVLPESTIRQLVRAAREQSVEFGLLVETLALTGARVSQLARCQIRDLAGERLMVPSSAKGQNKRASRTPVPVPVALADRLRVGAQGRPQSDPLLVKPSGDAWAKSDHARPFKRAVESIGEDKETVSSYALRHSHITAQLLAGLPVQLVAKLHDTSASQIEKHYAATIASHTDELVRASMIEMDRPAADIVPLRKA